MRDFVAIDFETANECASSVCSIGAVLVRNGKIVKTFYSLIKPEPDYYKWFCQQVHGYQYTIDELKSAYKHLYGAYVQYKFSLEDHNIVRNKYSIS